MLGEEMGKNQGAAKYIKNYSYPFRVIDGQNRNL